MRRVVSWTMYAAIAVTFSWQAYAGPAFTLPSPSAFRNGTWSFGEIFTVGAQDITVTALGAYDDGGDGFVTTGGIPVGIFRESDDALLASINVITTDPLSDHFRYAPITPLTLLSGVAYRVVAVNKDDLYNIDSNSSVDPAITRSGYGYCGTSALTSCDAFAGPGEVWMANFQFGQDQGQVPEPLSFILSGSGLVALAIVRKRRRAA